MNASVVNPTIIEGYLRLLSNLSPSYKLDLIARLSASIKSDLSERPSHFQRSFGAFVSDQSAEEIMEEMRSNRTFNREIESF
jgi:hypothetical protein